MIDDQGWFDWAERVPGAPNKVNGLTSPARGFIAHSAEGYEKYLRDASANPGNSKSWHLSNLFSGRLLQHYPINAQCWSSGHYIPNDTLVAMEAEGLYTTPLNALQTATVVRVIQDLSEFKGWEPRRGKTLLEHKDYTATACPSGRYDWTAILAALTPHPPHDPTLDVIPGRRGLHPVGEYEVLYVQGVPVWRYGGVSPGVSAKNFGGKWIYLRNPGDGTARWSEEPGD